MRARLAAADRPLLEAVLQPRELEALDYGYRERVRDLHLPRIRELPRVLPGLFAEAAAPGAGGRLRRRGAALRPRLYDGLVPVAPEHARRRLRRAARAPGAPAARGPGGRAPPRGPRLRRRDPLPRRRGHRRRQPPGRCRVVRRALRRGRAWTTSPFPRAAASRTRSSPRSARRCTRTRASGLRVHAHGALRRARALRSQRAAGRRHPAGRARRRRRDSGGRRGGIYTFEQAEGILRRGEADIVAAARQTPRRSRLVREDAPGPRRPRAPLRVHQLLRGARSAAQGGHLQALGPEVRARRAGGALASDGKRRLNAPAWPGPPGDSAEPRRETLHRTILSGQGSS